MKDSERLPGAGDFEVNLGEVTCPFCDETDVCLESMTGGAANELLVRCGKCRSFFYVLKDTAFLRR